ncbi:hypothetical protein OH77DRAFT_1503904 [Trametes cingulata]|nr:hypothetical protein OH77DRAFT_1503904 [Trametes cingulata]
MINRGYDVWISDRDGQRIGEYNVELEGNDGKTMACYIPSESRKRFIINWKDHNGLHYTSFKCVVDGKNAGAKTCKPNRGGQRVGVRTSETAYGTFQFADLRTTDDEDALLGTDVASLEKVGTIEIHAVRVHEGQQSGRTEPFKPDKFAPVGAVHERSKKLGAHFVTLGEAVPCRPYSAKRHHSTPLDRREGSYATFIFRYRPPGLLQAQGVMPPPARAGGSSKGKGKARATIDETYLAPPSSSRKPTVKVKKELRPAISTDDVIELTDDDGDALDRKPVFGRPRVKREAGPRRAKVKADPDDVIDLTLDD